MSDIWASITNREIAAVFWFGVLLAFVLVGRDTRQGPAGVLRAFFTPLIVLPLILAALYASGEIYLTTKLGWWSLANLKTTVVWIITFAFVTMFEVVSAKNRKGGLSRITKEIFTVATVLTFITELQSFPLLVELIALPAVAVIVMAAEVAKHRPEHAPAAKLFGAITAMIGLGYFGFSLWMTIAEWQKNATWANALEFALPIWLSIGFLPFLYGWRIYIAYSETFVTISIFSLDPKLVPFARWLAITHIGSDIDLLERWRRSIQHSRPAEKTELRHSLTALLALNAQENAPPGVPPQQGWSPYLAMKFMTDMGFETGHYHHSFDEEWYASSLMRAFGNGMPMPNNIAYYIEGNASAATILKLKLNVNDPASPNEAENMFVVHCMHLLEQAVSLNAVERMKMDIATLGEFENEIPYGSVVLSREEFIGGIKGGYSRKFELRRGLQINGSS